MFRKLEVDFLHQGVIIITSTGDNMSCIIDQLSLPDIFRCYRMHKEDPKRSLEVEYRDVLQYR